MYINNQNQGAFIVIIKNYKLRVFVVLPVDQKNKLPNKLWNFIFLNCHVKLCSQSLVVVGSSMS